MSSDYTDLSVYQQIGHAHNLLANARVEADPSTRARLEYVLQELNDVLLHIPMDPTGMPLPFPRCSCHDNGWTINGA